MITDQETNKVFFSEYLKAYKCRKSIEAALNEQNIQFELLPTTKDIWVRDFMPIQIDES
jgi:agmatine deiminase